MIDKMSESVERHGMKINGKKTKVMKIGRSPSPIHITLNGETLKQVSNFKYLGTIITEEGSCEKEISTRIAMAKQAFSIHRILLTSRLNLHLKKRIVKTMVWSVLLYGSETWTLKTANVKRLESFEMWVWRRMGKISWTERVSNDEVLRIVGEERMLIKTCKERQKKWMGHILRHDGLLKDVIEGRLEGKRPRGRKRIMVQHQRERAVSKDERKSSR